MNLNEILFWTERDGLGNDEMSSRDPLGTETFAGQLAELILPGLTTITWRIQYLTLICLWLRFIKGELQEDNADEILEVENSKIALLANAEFSGLPAGTIGWTVSFIGNLPPHSSPLVYLNKTIPILSLHFYEDASVSRYRPKLAFKVVKSSRSFEIGEKKSGSR